MFLVVYLQQGTASLHSTREAAEAACEALMKRFGIGPNGDENGDEVHLYRIECDGGPAEFIGLSSDLAAA
jgi:hypothetical protein